MPALWFQSINSFLIIVFAPVFAGIWTWFGARNISISAPAKFALGLALAGVGFFIMIFPANMLVASGGAVKVAVGVGLAIIALMVILTATGVIVLDPQVVGGYMIYALVGLAVAFFLFMFIAGKLNSDEKKRVVVIGVLFIFAAIFWAAFEQAPTSLNLFA